MTVTPGTKYFFEVDWDGTVAGLRINNGARGVSAVANNTFTGSTIPLRVGNDSRSGTTYPATGGTLIDELNIWPGRLLTDPERSYLYNSGAGNSVA